MSVNTNYIKDKGGNKLALFEFDSVTNTLVTASLTSGTNFIDLGQLSSSGSNITPSTTTFKSEDGIVRASDTTFEGKTEGVLMQTSKELIDFLAFTTRSRKYIQYKYEGYKNAKNQESFSVVDVESGYTLQTPGGVTAFKYSSIMTARDSAVSLTTTQIATMKTAIGNSLTPYVTTAVSIPANQEILFCET